MSTKVVSEKQLNANRTNAKRSTGPRTPAGKARVATNAVRSITKDLILTDEDPAEISRDFNELLTSLRDQLKPKNPLETVLVERIATCYWRLRRAIRFESKAIQSARQQSQSPMAEISRQFNNQKYDPYATVLPSYNDLNKLVTYESMLDRQLHRTMNHLRRLRATDALMNPVASSQPETTAGNAVPPYEGGTTGGSD